MHDLAPLMAGSTIAAWTHAPIPARVIDNYHARHFKMHADSEAGAVALSRLPGPLTIARLGDVDALWIGPGEWLALATTASRVALRELEDWTRTNGIASVSCESRLVVLAFAAPVDAIAHLTGLPATSLAPGRVARTRLADIPVTIVVDNDQAFRLILDRTHAPHLRAWFDRAF